MTTIAERVAAGAAFLDKEEPGWVDRIDLDRLDISSTCQCVLGQLHGDYFDATYRLELDFPEELAFTTSIDPEDEGHYLPLDVEQAGITDAWRELIVARRREPTHDEIAVVKREEDR